MFKSGREEFLALGKTLAGQTNPLWVIAWGHGGVQGRTPVLHVRGPRLTSDDFKAFVAQRKQEDSRWVLFFRGSGSFARELMGDGRQIISSENETSFTSDPIGMGLLLKAVGDQRAISFQSLAEELGRATAAWYSERALARTEEPTLWMGRAKPRLLAAENPDQLASEPAARKQVNSNTTPGEPSAVWKDITRVEPQNYPDAAGIVLRRRMSYTLGSNPAIATEHEEFLQILTAEGKHLGDFDFAYSPPLENITFRDCEVLQTNGSLVRLDPDDVREAASESLADYPTGRRKFFSLPGVVPGAVLRLRYFTEWKR